MGDWFGYEKAGFGFGIIYFLCAGMVLLRLLVRCLCLFSLLKAFLLVLCGLVTGQQRFLILVEWDILVVRVCMEFFLILAELISGSNINI
jgi:hypothetical protein